jgi:hypothetical protein
LRKRLFGTIIGDLGVYPVKYRMLSNSEDAARNALQHLTGESVTDLAHCENAIDVLSRVSHDKPIGFSQFNEVLLACGFDRICADYFDYLVSGELSPKSAPRLESLLQLNKASERGQILALFAFGNVKFGFRTFGRNSGALRLWVSFLSPINTDRYEHRLPPSVPIEDIAVEKRYLLGYLSGFELNEKLNHKPKDKSLLKEKEEQNRLIEIGKLNQNAYLVSDHLDIYVATSMRQRHEYTAVASFCDSLFQSTLLKPLNLRYFDPTLAYASDRIDKGLSEALMLKRAKLTVFLAQESDTLGKDSELASTLAQGKPVIAYVPDASEEGYFDKVESDLTVSYPGQPLAKLLVNQLRYFKPALAWDDPIIRNWLGMTDEDFEEKTSDIQQFFRHTVVKHYDDRAELLRERHPLGIQVTLNDGVAVGVLVVRTIEQCAQLVRCLLTSTTEFKLKYRNGEDGQNTHLCLYENISNSAYRVMTYDRSLNNCFWNFYLYNASTN